ncbi:nucleotidyltransferase family protein [Pseudomonadota bacterium 24LQ007]
MAETPIPDIFKEHAGDLADLRRRHHVSHLAVFGSATTDRFREESDLDFLVSFEAGLSARQTAAAFFDLKLELEALFKRPVDLITKASLTNPYFRQSVLAVQGGLYAA